MRPYTQLPTSTLATGEEGGGPSTLLLGEETGYEHESYEAVNEPFGEF